MNNLPYIDYLVPYQEYDYEIYQLIFPWKKVGNLISLNEAQYDIQSCDDNLISEIFTDSHKIDNEEVNNKEQKSIDNKALYEIKIPENKDYANKTTTQNTNTNKNANINENIEIIEPFKEPDNNLLGNKRREPSFFQSK